MIIYAYGITNRANPGFIASLVRNAMNRQYCQRTYTGKPLEMETIAASLFLVNSIFMIHCT